MRRTFALAALGCLVAPATPAEARVVRIEVERTAPYAGGREFGDAGRFERLDGTVHMEVDPDDPRNAVIVNLARARRNDRGLVEFSAPFFLIKPVDMARGNGKLLYGINNRGNAIELGFHTFPSLPPGVGPRRRRRAVLPPRLHPGGRRVGRRRGDHGDAARREPARGDAGRRQPRSSPASASSTHRTRRNGRSTAPSPTRCRSRGTTAS